MTNDGATMADAYEAPPAACTNPWAAGSIAMDLMWEGVRGIARVVRRRREIRLLNRIGVLPPDWDAAGRHPADR